LKQAPEDDHDNSQTDPEENASVCSTWSFFVWHSLFLFPGLFYHFFYMLKTKLSKK